MLAHPGKSRADRDARNRLELHQIDDGDVAVPGGDVRGEMQVRPKERRAMLAKKQHNPAYRQNGKQEVNAKVLWAIHCRDGILPCIDDSSKAARLNPNCAPPAKGK